MRFSERVGLTPVSTIVQTGTMSQTDLQSISTETLASGTYIVIIETEQSFEENKMKKK